MDTRPSTVSSLRLHGVADFQLHELTGAAGLRVQLLRTGALFAFRHRETLINQLLPGPAENGLFRLLVRWRDSRGAPIGWAPLIGPPVAFSCGPEAASWQTVLAGPGLTCTTTLALATRRPGWIWRVQLHNTGAAPRWIDLLHAQDLGLADEAAVRNNEAYTSHYIDLRPVRDDVLGWTILARQNLPMAQGHHPWLAVACASGAAEFCTDGTQFFGADHRRTNEPAAVRLAALPSRCLQYEFALAGLQSRAIDLAPGATAEISFVARYVEDHPAASAEADLALLRELVDEVCIAPPRRPDHRLEADAAPEPAGMPAPPPPSIFVTAPWLHGDVPTSADWDRWFAGARRHEEFSRTGHLLAFFHGTDTHVVSGEKETAIARPHGHILRSGDARWFDGGHFGLTCYAAGIFSAQAYLGHPSFARLLSVVRNPLNVTRACGQRVFVRRNDTWQQLGIPSAFAMSPGEARWIYRFGEDLVEARISCARDLPAACLELRVVVGRPHEFLVTHELALGATEFEHGGTWELWPDEGWMGGRPDPASLVGKHQPEICFAIAAASVKPFAVLGGDGLLYADGVERGGPYATLRSAPVKHCAVILLGGAEGPSALSNLVAAARVAFSQSQFPARPPEACVRLRDHDDDGVARLDEILPWFTHNAAIHFSAPHGLEQYGGAAWGVRDVCQGSVEWLLAQGDFAIVRRILETVFAQQYAQDGSWPQWFMFPPYRFIQQPHSHGDVCFWPVKALCDYVEASNDTDLLHARLGYTDPHHFAPGGPHETLLEHCDRVVAQCEARFIAGTSLVNYGDGDWDDTLQPADPAMRTHMVSPWTVELAFHAFRQLRDICRRSGETARADHLDALLARIRRDFAALLMPDGVVAGFVIFEPKSPDGPFVARPLIHPSDVVTGIRYRLLPMTRGILAELFTPNEARRHLELIARELRYPDGVRLMSEPSTYHGGRERLFKRAETAANVGREIGLQYVHAHLRYAEALAKVGDADELWAALQVVNPVGLVAVVPNAASRQSNVYFSSSDADFADRAEASARWAELRSGKVAVRGGWRLYSSGPGLFLHKIRSCLLGVRESFGDVVFDPVLPHCLDGLTATVTLLGQPVELVYHVKSRTSSPHSITVNGSRLKAVQRETNPYRAGGLRVSAEQLTALLSSKSNRVEIEL